MPEDEVDRTIIIIASKHCPACKELKERMRDRIEKGEAVSLDIEDSDIALRIVEMFDIRSVPQIVVVERKKGDDSMTFCLIDKRTGEPEKCIQKPFK